MVKPSPALFGRLRFTTKQVGRGFYRGNRTGSMGAHTEYGRYKIDWRKTVHYNVPDTTDFPLSPFVTMEMEKRTRVEERPDGSPYTPETVDGVEFLRSWKKLNPVEYDQVIAHQEQMRADQEAAAHEEGQEEGQEQIQEQVQQQVHTQISERGQSPFQQQTRQMHTSSRRLITAEVTPPEAERLTKEWNDMTREERKELVNTATTEQLRQLKKQRNDKSKITRLEKKKLKMGIKLRLRQELIGYGIFQDKKEYEKMMTEEGRRREREGLPRRMPEEKREFLIGLLKNSGKAPGMVEQILSGDKELERLYRSSKKES